MSSPEIDELFGKVCDGLAGEGDLRELHRRLRAEPETLDAWVRFVDLHAALAATDVLGLGGPAALPSKAQPSESIRVLPAPIESAPIIARTDAGCAPSPGESPWTRRRWLAMAASIGVAATGAALWARWGGRGLAFARVIQNAGALLTREGKAISTGAILPAGRLVLTQGSLGLRYGRGVDLVIEAPAEFECRHADLFVLYSGRIAAHVPPSAVGFAVESAHGRVVDRGTRFALEASADAPTEVHVFEGKVDAHSRNGAAAGRTLVTGQAATLTHALTDRALRDGAFVQPEELPAVVAALRAGQQKRWLRWRDQIQADPALILFSELDPRRLAHGDAARRMQIVGARAVQGRWPGKQCLDFAEQNDAVTLDVGGEQAWPQVTLAAWVRLDRLGAPYQSLYHTDGWHAGRPGQMHWMITKATTMRLALRDNNLPGEKPNGAVWADSRAPVLPERGRWVHLAAVYNAVAHAIRFYLNGEFDSEVAQETAHPALLGPAQIGNWDRQDRRLSGRVDEFMILGRALSDAEVQAIHAAGNPYA